MTEFPMTIIARILSTLLHHPEPWPWLTTAAPPVHLTSAVLNRARPRSPAERGNQSSAPANADLADLQTYQASQQGLIERDVHELAAATAALVQYAIAPPSRHLVAKEANNIESVVLRLRFVLRVLAGEVEP